jgi:hypothetical protein
MKGGIMKFAMPWIALVALILAGCGDFQLVSDAEDTDDEPIAEGQTDGIAWEDGEEDPIEVPEDIGGTILKDHCSTIYSKKDPPNVYITCDFDAF